MKIQTNKRSAKECVDSAVPDLETQTFFRGIEMNLDSLVESLTSQKSRFGSLENDVDEVIKDILLLKGRVRAIGDACYTDEQKSLVDRASIDMQCSPDSTVKCPDNTCIANMLLDITPEVATEALGDGNLSKEDMLSWLATSTDVAAEFADYFANRGVTFNGSVITADDLTDEEVENWILDHDTVAEAFSQYFDGASDDWMVLKKESDDLDEAFLEYRFPDKLMAQGEFFTANVPVASLHKEKGKWVLYAVSADISDSPELKALLDEQVDLLNSD